MTLQTLYNLIIANITPSGGVDRITSAETRAVLEAMRGEFLNRGMSQVADTSLLATLPNTEARYCLIDNVGFFKDTDTGPANGITCFAGMGGRFWRMVEETTIPLELNTDGTIIIPAGRVLYMISITPTNADTIIIGTTLAGEEILPSRDFIANEDLSILTTLVARVDKTLYFAGITDTTEIRIYTKPL